MCHQRSKSANFRRGDSSPFARWLASLKDRQARAIIRIRINRLRLGDFGDSHSVGGGIHELRIDYGPGYRVYFGRNGATIVILLCGGDKKTQPNDIETASKYWKEHQDANKS